MANRSTFGLFLLASGSFVGGVALGLLLSRRSGREHLGWLYDNTAEITDWVNHKGRRAFHKGEKQFNHLRKNLKREYRDIVPDLYTATEHIDWD